MSFIRQASGAFAKAVSTNETPFYKTWYTISNVTTLVIAIGTLVCGIMGFYKTETFPTDLQNNVPYSLAISAGAIALVTALFGIYNNRLRERSATMASLYLVLMLVSVGLSLAAYITLLVWNGDLRTVQQAQSYNQLSSLTQRGVWSALDDNYNLCCKSNTNPLSWNGNELCPKSVMDRGFCSTTQSTQLLYNQQVLNIAVRYNEPMSIVFTTLNSVQLILLVCGMAFLFTMDDYEGEIRDGEAGSSSRSFWYASTCWITGANVFLLFMGMSLLFSGSYGRSVFDSAYEAFQSKSAYNLAISAGTITFVASMIGCTGFVYSANKKPSSIYTYMFLLFVCVPLALACGVLLAIEIDTSRAVQDVSPGNLAKNYLQSQSEAVNTMFAATTSTFAGCCTDAVNVVNGITFWTPNAQCNWMRPYLDFNMFVCGSFDTFKFFSMRNFIFIVGSVGLGTFHLSLLLIASVALGARMVTKAKEEDTKAHITPAPMDATKVVGFEATTGDVPPPMPATAEVI